MPPSASGFVSLSWIPIDPSNVSNYKAGRQMVGFSFSAIIHYSYFFMGFFLVRRWHRQA
jgi:hypothetical protein